MSDEIKRAIARSLADGDVVFLVDSCNEAEQSLLKDYIQRLHLAEQNGRPVRKIVVPIVQDLENIPSSLLMPLVNEADATLVVPLRVVWIDGAKATSRISVTRLFQRKAIRPSDANAAKIINEKPDQAIVALANAATIADLKSRYTKIGGDTSDEQGLCDFIAGQAALALDVAERQHTGSRYKVPLRVADNLKINPSFNEALVQLSVETGKSLASLKKERDVIMKEMIAIPSPFWIDVGSHMAQKLTSLAYESEIVLDQGDVERTRELVNKYPTAFLWTHKTHVDGMAMQKVLYENNFPSAHTFGGLNMAFAGVGRVARRSGLIFIRRTFKDNPLYKLILRHYIGYVLEKRFPFSWAFEGTRSRVGKLMPPRYGLLKYLIEAAQTTNTRNLHIIPVAINYDVIGDADDYAKEQAGESKRAESLSWFLGYVKGMRQPMGRIYLDFGKPVVLSEVPDADDRIAMAKVAFQVGVEVNRVSPITLASTVTMILLSALPRALTADELANGVAEVVQWARKRGVRVSSDFTLENKSQSETLFEILISKNLITRFEEGSTSLYSIGPEQHVVASYYRNTIVHYFVNKSIAELSLLAVAGEPSRSAEVFWNEAERLRDLFKFEFFYSPSDQFRQEITNELNRFDPHWEESLSVNDRYADQLLRSLNPLFAHATLTQFAEAYWVAATILSQHDSPHEISEKDFVAQCLSYGRQAYLQRRIRSKASVGKELYRNGFKLLVNLGMTEQSKESAQKRDKAPIDFRTLINRLERIRSRALPL